MSRHDILKRIVLPILCAGLMALGLAKVAFTALRDNLCAVAYLSLSLVQERQGVEWCEYVLPQRQQWTTATRPSTLRVAAHGAMVEQQFHEAVAAYDRLAKMQPDNLVVRLQLAEAYHREMNSHAAEGQYSVLSELLERYGADTKLRELVARRIAENDRLARLQVGLEMMARAEWVGAAQVFDDLLDKDPDDYLAAYYAYATAKELGRERVSLALLPKLARFRYDQDVRLRDLQNNVLPGAVIPLLEANLWTARQANDFYTFVYWQGHPDAAEKLVEALRQRWPDWSESTVRAEKPGPAAECSDIRLESAESMREPGVLPDRSNQGATRPIGSICEPAENTVTQNIVDNGNFEQTEEGFPFRWFFTRSVVYEPASDRWTTDPAFEPFAGTDKSHLCEGKRSARLQIVWSDDETAGKFAGISQQLDLERSGTYVLDICYVAEREGLKVGLVQGSDIVLDVDLPPSTGPCTCIRQNVTLVADLDPLFLALKLTAVGWARIEAVALHEVNESSRLDTDRIAF